MTGQRTEWWDTVGVVVVAVLAGHAVWAAHRLPPVLVPPVECAGLLELAAAAFARAQPSAPLGRTLLAANAWVSAAGIAALVWAISRRSRHWIIAGAIGLAAAAQPVFDPRVAVPDGLAFLAAALTAAVLSAPLLTARHWQLAAVGVFASAAFEPALALVLLPIGGWMLVRPGASGRSWVAIVAVVGAVATTLAVFAAAPSLPGTTAAPGGWLRCLASPARPDGIVAIGRFTGLEAVTPYVFGLAVLGAFANRHRFRDPPVRAFAAFAVLPLLVAVWTRGLHPHALAPAVTALWIVAAAGLRELLRACTRRPIGWIAAAFFIALVPFAQLNAIREPASPAPSLEGHEALTRADIATLLGVLPDDSVLVVDDAVTDVLLRASYRSWRGTGKMLRVVNGPALGVPPAVPPARHLYAFPWSARQLTSSGFRDADGNVPAPLPIRHLQPGGECTQVPRDWRALDGLAIDRDLAIGSVRPSDEGPVVIYAATVERPAPQSVDWPALTTRGFHAAVYDTGGTEALRHQMDKDQVPAEVQMSTPYVTRFELWRTPNAPRILRVRLGVPSGEVMARLQLPDERHRIVICPAY